LELHRILKPTGALRISTPDLDKISNKLRIAEVESTLQLYEMSKLKENLWLSGFIDVKICVCGESNYPELCNLEHKSEDGDLIVEARKFLVDL
jgi:predicted SAM-dependent methyltransferase